MCVSVRYTPLGARRALVPEQASYFMMNCLLYSRMECAYPSNAERFDEDVNVYLAGLLTSVIRAEPRILESAALALDDIALAERAAAASRTRERYELYRSSADRLLIALGIFKNARERRPSVRAPFAFPDRVYMGRGAAYYSLAQSYAVETFRRATAVSECLGKLSRGFGRYVDVLSTMRGEYLDIRETLSDGALFHLERSATAAEASLDMASRYDRFLDAYSVYMRSRTPATRAELEAICAEIRSIDPSFSFDLSERESVTSP